jgi:hypothetical protein
MAKATIIIEDKEDGSVGVRVELDPPLKPNDKITPAQYCASALLNAIYKGLLAEESPE